MSLSVVVLTLDAETTLKRTLEAAAQVSEDLHVVDSGSRDGTREIAAAFGAHWVEHPFTTYDQQRNWAIDHLDLKSWQLHLDADEFLSDELVREIQGLDLDSSTTVTGYHLPRLQRFLGRDLRHGGYYPTYHLRLFRSGTGRCERRLYDQHFVAQGATAVLRNPMVDDVRMPISTWIARHNRWSDLEAEQLWNTENGRAHSEIAPSWRGTPIQRQRAKRSLYDRFPLLIRPFLLFFYRYILRFGWLDGRAGLVYCVLQAFWYRFLVDVKLIELRRRGTANPPDDPS